MSAGARGGDFLGSCSPRRSPGAASRRSRYRWTVEAGGGADEHERGRAAKHSVGDVRRVATSLSVEADVTRPNGLGAGVTEDDSVRWLVGPDVLECAV